MPAVRDEVFTIETASCVALQPLSSTVTQDQHDATSRIVSQPTLACN